MQHAPVRADKNHMAYVLIVDDEAPIRRLLARWLEGWGYAVKEAGNAPEALDAMLAEPASIVLCDIKMPEHDGLWLVERLRARWPTTAIIMATSVQNVQTVIKTRQEGVVDYITKPFGREAVLQALRRAGGVAQL